MASYEWPPSGGSGGGVTSLNGEVGDVTLVAGTGISITPAGQNITITNTSPSSGGTVTSVALVDSTGLFNITGSPVTASGTLTLTSFQSQAANTFFAAPNGSAGAPTFRAIVAADVPILNQNTTGTASNVTGVVAIANGGSGQITANAALNAFLPSQATHSGQFLTTDGTNTSWATAGSGSGTVTSVSVVTANGLAGTVATSTTTPAITLSTTVTGILQGNGTAISAAVAGTDYVIPSGSITGTASNITATSNSTLTTLSALSLPYSQLTGAPAALIFSDSLVNTAGTVTLVNDSASPTASQYYGTNAGSVLGYYNLPSSGSGTVTSVDMTVPSFLSVSGNPVTTSGTLAVTYSGTALPVANGGTGDTSFTANQVILGGTTSTGPLAQVPGGTAGYILTSNGTTAAPTFQPAPGTVSAFYASTQVTTDSSVVNTTAFTTFSNSPAFTFTPSITGTYKVYASIPLYTGAGVNESIARVFETSALATLLEESEAKISTVSPSIQANVAIQSVYTLTAGTTYTFDIQGKLATFPGDCEMVASTAPFYMFAELEATGSLPLQVSDINGLSGSITLAAGTGLGLGTVGNTLTLSLNTPVSIANGGTDNGSLPVTAGGVLYTDGTKFQNVGAGTAGYFLTSNGASAPTWTAGGGGGATFQFFASSQVTTDSSVINTTAFTTFSNSPGFNFTPTVSGTYKVYASPNLYNGGSNSSIARIFETSAVATLLYESQGKTTANSSTSVESTTFIQSVYTLVASTAYTFDIQGKLTSFPGDCEMVASASPFYMFAEQCG